MEGELQVWIPEWPFPCLLGYLTSIRLPFKRMCFFLTQKEQLDVLGCLDAILLQVLFNLLGPGPWGALLRWHGTPHLAQQNTCHGEVNQQHFHWEFDATERRGDHRQQWTGLEDDRTGRVKIVAVSFTTPTLGCSGLASSPVPHDCCRSFFFQLTIHVILSWWWKTTAFQQRLFQTHSGCEQTAIQPLELFWPLSTPNKKPSQWLFSESHSFKSFWTVNEMNSLCL